MRISAIKEKYRGAHNMGIGRSGQTAGGEQAWPKGRGRAGRGLCEALSKARTSNTHKQTPPLAPLIFFTSSATSGKRMWEV